MEQPHLPNIDADQLRQALEQDFNECIKQVTEAINTTRTGAIIDESEEPVRDAMAKLRQKVFQKALQMKTDAASAAFSPSGQNKRQKKVPQ
jgi:hypothetical protein